MIGTPSPPPPLPCWLVVIPPAGKSISYTLLLLLVGSMRGQDMQWQSCVLIGYFSSHDGPIYLDRFGSPLLSGKKILFCAWPYPLLTKLAHSRWLILPVTRNLSDNPVIGALFSFSGFASLFFIGQNFVLVHKNEKK